LDAIDATAQDIIECSLEHCAARSRALQLLRIAGRSSTAVFARSWFAITSRDFGSVGVRHPVGRGGKASGIFEINVDRSKRIRTCAWTTLVQRLARREAISHHGVQHPRYGDTNASWEDA
jgi:hypothetical protein